MACVHPENPLSFKDSPCITWFPIIMKVETCLGVCSVHKKTYIPEMTDFSINYPRPVLPARTVPYSSKEPDHAPMCTWRDQERHSTKTFRETMTLLDKFSLHSDSVLATFMDHAKLYHSCKIIGITLTYSCDQTKFLESCHYSHNGVTCISSRSWMARKNLSNRLAKVDKVRPWIASCRKDPALLSLWNMTCTISGPPYSGCAKR